MTIKIQGVVNLHCFDRPVDVQDVLEVPELAANVLSVSKICSKAFTVVFLADHCEVLRSVSCGTVVISRCGTDLQNLYCLKQLTNDFSTMKVKYLNYFVSQEAIQWSRSVWSSSIQTCANNLKYHSLKVESPIYE